MFSNPEPEDDPDDLLDSYDIKWIMIYAVLAWAIVMALALPAMIIPSS